ncbi:SOS response-associated peptidase family protein [Rhodohalobacter halophilus]|uniref:SOS response-associated peptidase family protein n=1 Tax=Rhodohalobacter halophilus TaxID=1812810 RepID=UPI00083FC6BA|nr:SOS response-associated peptidase family protein [Rhodohalobacter halophilus]
MPKRVAFFPGKEPIENYFNIQSKREQIFEPHYNLTPGQHIPVVFKNGDTLSLDRIRWGDENSRNTTVPVNEAAALTDDKKWIPCAIPLSGFYIWKDDKEEGSPFFIRMLSGPLMVAAGLLHSKEEYFQIITTEANVLIKPMSETMPLLFDRELSHLWLNQSEEVDNILNRAKNLFLLTDLSVTRVSEEVNDPSNNSEELVQPIPK